jgi:hypothetical protein
MRHPQRPTLNIETLPTRWQAPTYLLGIAQREIVMSSFRPQLRFQGRGAPLWPWIVIRWLSALAHWLGNQY